MDNQDSTPSQTIPPNQVSNIHQASSPSLLPKPKLPFIIFGVIVLFLTVTGGIVLGKYLYVPMRTLPENTSNIPTICPTAVTPTPDLTANWKVYTNTKYRYRLKYPDDWYEAKEESDSKLFLDRQPTQQNLLNVVNLVIFLNKRPSQYSTNKQYFDSIYNQTYTTPQPLQIETILIKKFTMDGEQAIMLMDKGKPGSGFDTNLSLKVYTYHHENIFEIALLGPKEIVEKYRPLFDQILSTFKFL